MPKSEIANDGIKITEPCHDGFHLIDFEFNMCGGDTKCPEDIVACGAGDMVIFLISVGSMTVTISCVTMFWETGSTS